MTSHIGIALRSTQGMSKSLLAIMLLLPLVAQTHGNEGLEGNSTESLDAMQKQYCLIGGEIEAKLRL